MTVHQERRQSDQDADELSPELVALLLACGGEVREADRELLAGRHSDLFDRRRPERRRTEIA